MTTRQISFPAVLLVAVAALGLGSAPAPKPADLRLPFKVGEALEYSGSWQGLDAATANLAVTKGARPGTLRLKAAARTSPLIASFLDARFESEVECEASTLLPLRVRRIQEERGKSRVEEAVFDRARGTVSVDGGPARPVDVRAHDPVTALYGLRAMRFGRLGSVVRVPVSDLGEPVDLDIEVLDRRDGLVSLKLVSTPRAAPAERSVVTVSMEESGPRRIVEMLAPLPFGEVKLGLRR